MFKEETVFILGAGASVNYGYPTGKKLIDNIIHAIEEDAYRKLNADLLHQGEHKLRHFIAYYKNELSAAGTLFISNDSVMLHNLATKKRFQQLGIGTALAIHQMRIAKQLGFKHCFLDSSDEAFNLYRKIGFKVYGVTKAYS